MTRNTTRKLLEVSIHTNVDGRIDDATLARRIYDSMRQMVRRVEGRAQKGMTAPTETNESENGEPLEHFSPFVLHKMLDAQHESATRTTL